MLKMEVYKTKQAYYDGEWAWRIKSANGRILGQSVCRYNTRQTARKTAKIIEKNSYGMEYVEADK